jgi:replicative DNA helicase
MPKRLLRSVIEFDTEISVENLQRNFQRLRRSVDANRFSWQHPADEVIYKYVQSFFGIHLEVPSLQTVLNYLQDINNVEAAERVKDIAAEQPYARTQFSELLRNLQEQQASLKLRVLLKESNEILTKGIRNEKTGELVRGPEAAVQHFTLGAREVLLDEMSSQISGDIRQDGDVMRNEYEKAESDPQSTFGVLCGINEIDNNCKGIKPGELWIHAAFPSELKTFFANNWAYNAMVRFKTNVVFISLEMTRPIMRRNVYALHTANHRFWMQGYEPLDYKNIRDGKLTLEQKDFYVNHVIKDFESNPTYGIYELVIPDKDWTMSDIRSEVEILNKQFEVGLIIIDYGLLVQPITKRKNDSYTVEMNSIITSAKRMALTFNMGQMVPILMLFQINRSGKDEADKNDGVYKMNALSWANSAEKDADVITTTYLNQERRDQRRTTISNLKNRDNPQFEPFDAHIMWEPRKILSPARSEPNGFAVTEHEADLIRYDQV